MAEAADDADAPVDADAPADADATADADAPVDAEADDEADDDDAADADANEVDTVFFTVVEVCETDCEELTARIQNMEFNNDYTY